MTREEYLKLVQESEAFKGMDQELQQKILTAEGKEMEKFATIFQDENSFMSSAKKELVENNNEAIKNMDGNVKTLKKDYLKNEEVSAEKDDEANANNLLNSI